MTVTAGNFWSVLTTNLKLQNELNPFVGNFGIINFPHDKPTRNTGSTLPDPFVAWHRNGRQKPGSFASFRAILQHQWMVIQASIETCLESDEKMAGWKGVNCCNWSIFCWNHCLPLKYTKPIRSSTHEKQVQETSQVLEESMLFPNIPNIFWTLVEPPSQGRIFWQCRLWQAGKMFGGDLHKKMQHK